MENIVELTKVANYLRQCEANKFYGKLYLSFNNGKITNMKLEASLDLKQFQGVENE